VRRSAWSDIGGYDPTIQTAFGGWDDYDFWLRMAARGKSGVLVADFVARQPADSPENSSSVGLGASRPLAFLRGRYPTLPWPNP
jgi:hypothetical protein